MEAPFKINAKTESPSLGVKQSFHNPFICCDPTFLNVAVYLKVDFPVRRFQAATSKHTGGNTPKAWTASAGHALHHPSHPPGGADGGIWENESQISEEG